MKLFLESAVWIFTAARLWGENFLLWDRLKKNLAQFE
jgi:hypothetical protein